MRSGRELKSSGSNAAMRSLRIFAWPEPKGAPTVDYFYEIRSADNAVLKRDGGFASQDAAKMAAREDAKKMKNSRHLGVPSSPAYLSPVTMRIPYSFKIAENSST